MKRTHTNWSDNSKHSLWPSRRKKLQIVDSLGELFLFVAYRKTDKGSDHLLEKANFDEFSNCIHIQVLYIKF